MTETRITHTVRFTLNGRVNDDIIRALDNSFDWFLNQIISPKQPIVNVESWATTMPIYILLKSSPVYDQYGMSANLISRWSLTSPKSVQADVHKIREELFMVVL